jgi:hypothetical protein
MALKAKLPNLDGLSEAVKALYRQEGEYFVLDVESVDGWSLEDVNGLKSALGAQKAEVTKLNGQLKAFKSEDGTVLDPVVAREAIEKAARYEKMKPEEMAQERVRTALDQANSQHKTIVDGKDGEIAKLKKVIESVMVDQAATSALAKAGGNIKLLLPHVKSSTRVVQDESGNFKVEVFDSAGNPRVATKGGKAGDMTIDDLVSEMAASTDFGTAFDSKARSGGNSTSGNGNGNGGRPKVIDADDQGSLSASLEDIAAGKVAVRMGGESALA